MQGDCFAHSPGLFTAYIAVEGRKSSRNSCRNTNTNTSDGIVLRGPRGALHPRPPRRLGPLDHDGGDELFHGEHPYVDLEYIGDKLV